MKIVQIMVNAQIDQARSYAHVMNIFMVNAVRIFIFVKLADHVKMVDYVLYLVTLPLIVMNVDAHMDTLDHNVNIEHVKVNHVHMDHLV